MATVNPAVVLQQVFEMLRPTGASGIQPAESRDGEKVQIYQSPTIIQFYLGGCGPPGPGDEDGSAANGIGPNGGHVRDGRVEVPVGHGQSHREAFELRKDGAGADGQSSLTGAGPSSQAQQDLDAATVGAGRELATSAAPDTASMNRSADALIAAMMRGKKFTPRHRRLLALALREHPRQAYEEYRRPGSTAQLHQEGDEEDSDEDDDDERFAGSRYTELTPQSRQRYDRERYLDQTHGLTDFAGSTLASPKPIGPSRDERVQASGYEEVAGGDPSSSAADADEILVSGPLCRRITSTDCRSDGNALHGSSKQPEDTSEGDERVRTSSGKHTRLDRRSGAERLRSRERPGRPQSVHEPKMMPPGTSLRRRSLFRGLLLKGLARKRNCSDAVAAGDQDVTAAEPDESGRDPQAAGDEDHGSVEAGKTDEDGDEIRVQVCASKRRKIVPESSDGEVNVSGEQIQQLWCKLTAARTRERAIFEAQISSHSENAAGIEALRLDDEHKKAKRYRRGIERRIEKLKVMRYEGT